MILNVERPPILVPRALFGRDSAEGIAIVNACRDEITALYGELKKEPLTDLSCFTDAGGFIMGAMLGEELVACGGIIPLKLGAEMRSIYVVRHHRGQGIGRKMVEFVERQAARRGFRTMYLEAGLRQPVARRLYESMGYYRIPNYDDHAGRDDQFCYAKELTSR